MIGRNATIADSRIVDNSTNEEITQVAGGVAVYEPAVVTMVRTLVSGNSISMSIPGKAVALGASGTAAT
jgi:hypothetical protein